MDNTQNQNEQASDGNEQTHTVVIYGELGDGPQTQVVILDETMWLTQRQMSTLFNVSVPTINAHLKNVFESRELDETSVIRNFLITAADGKKYNTKHYSLDAIISVGYRVNPENRGIYTQSDSSKKSSRNIWSLAVVSVDQRY